MQTQVTTPKPTTPKPCSWCESTLLYAEYLSAHQEWLISCRNCGVEGPTTSTHEEAVDAWNRLRDE